MTEIKQATRDYERWLSAHEDELPPETRKQGRLFLHALRALCMGKNADDATMREITLRYAQEFEALRATNQ